MSALIEEAFHRANTRFAPTIEVRFLNVAASLVEAGLGVAVVDELTGSSEHFSKLIVRPFKPRIGITVSVVHAKDKTLSRLAQIFLEHARAEIQAIETRAKTQGPERTASGARSHAVRASRQRRE
jgi:DNA-binding transcriptional LysR family regulator